MSNFIFSSQLITGSVQNGLNHLERKGKKSEQFLSSIKQVSSPRTKSPNSLKVPPSFKPEPLPSQKLNHPSYINAKKFASQNLTPLTTLNSKPRTSHTPKPLTTQNPKPFTTQNSESLTTQNPKPHTTWNPKPLTTQNLKPFTTQNPESLTTQNPKPRTTQNPKPLTTQNPKPFTTQNSKPRSLKDFKSLPLQIKEAELIPFLSSISSILEEESSSTPMLVSGLVKLAIVPVTVPALLSTGIGKVVSRLKR